VLARSRNETHSLKGVRFNATAISTAVRPASSISESRFSSPDVQRLAGGLEVHTPAAAHEACQHMIPEKGIDFVKTGRWQSGQLVGEDDYFVDRGRFRQKFVRLRHERRSHLTV
jgi:hypothetical protein